MRGGWSLTGRAEELGLVDRVMRLTSGPTGVFLAGEAGVGKTRLAREALAAARRRGMVVRWATATMATRGIPLGLFTVFGASGGDLATATRRTFDLLSDGGSDGRPVVLGVDDAHLLDEVSALVLYQLASRGLVRLVVTVRNGTSVPETVTALWKEQYLERLEVVPLAEPTARDLLRTVLGGDVDSVSAQRIWALTRGNPLYLRLLVEGERAAGRLRATAGVWRWSGEPRLSRGLTELVEARMGELPEPLRDVIDLLALSEPLGVVPLVRLTSRAAVEQAEERGLLEISRDGQRLHARLAHPLYGEVRRASTGLLRARRLRGTLATTLGALGTRRADDVLRQAVLVMDSDLTPDTGLLLAAARAASVLGDVGLSERLARAAIAAGSGFEGRLLLAFALTWLNRGQEAEEQLRVSEPLARSIVEQSLVAIPRAGNLFWILRRPDEADEVLRRAEHALEALSVPAGASVAVDGTLSITDPDRAAQDGATVRAALAALRCTFDLWLGRPAEAVRAARAALEQTTLPDESVVLAGWGLSAGLGVLGRFDEARPEFPRLRGAVARIGDGPLLAMGLHDLSVLGLRLAGHLDEAQTLARTSYDELRQPFGNSHLMGITLLGHVAAARGYARTALRWLREAHAGLVDGGLGGWEIRALMSLTQSYAMLGAATEARVALHQLETGWHPGFALFEPDRALATAWVSAAEGAISEAIATLCRAAERNADNGEWGWEVLLRQTAARFGYRQGAARLAWLAQRVTGPRASQAAAHAAALAADDGAALLSVSSQLEDMRDLAAAADAAAQAALVHTRAGRRGQASVATARADRLARAGEGLLTPALAAALRPLPLTAREREIVSLATRGLSNLEISARLVISVRTVEGHILRAGQRLGVRGRTGLAAAVWGDTPAFEDE